MSSDEGDKIFMDFWDAVDLGFGFGLGLLMLNLIVSIVVVAILCIAWILGANPPVFP